MPLVYTFRCRLSPEAERVAFAEIDRSRVLYNQMIAQYNPHPRQQPLAICARHKLSESDCYTGSHMAVLAAFCAATSAKRVGKWPGDPYRFRSRFDLRGSKIGVVWMRHQAPMWGKILSGATSLLSPSPGPKVRRNYSQCTLRISRKDPPIEFTVNFRRRIPADAIVTAAYLVPGGEMGERRWWDLQVTFAAPACRLTTAEEAINVGVDIGWSMRDDGSMLVAMASNGDTLAIPAYAMRMAAAVEEIQSERDALANSMCLALAERGIQCPAKSANGVIGWIESNGIHGMIEQVSAARVLRRRQQHVLRRFLGIRDELYRDFASAHRGAFILKTALKPQAEIELKGTESNHERTWASLFSLALCLRERDAVEVACECLGDSLAPNAENAEKIRTNGQAGNLVIRAARKPHRKFRKSLGPQPGTPNAITTARLS